MRTSRRIGPHSSSRVVGGGSTAATPPLPGDAEAPGSPDGPATPPRASMAATEPGAMVDSSTSNRSTAKRTGAFGSAGGDDGVAEPGTVDPAGVGLATAVGRALAMAPWTEPD